MASCNSIAAAAAADGRSKTENVASPSPRVVISRPARDVTTCSATSSCRASATAMASASASQAAVDPSMSVSRKVTARVTDGRCCATGISRESSCATIAAPSRRSSVRGRPPARRPAATVPVDKHQGLHLAGRPGGGRASAGPIAFRAAGERSQNAQFHRWKRTHVPNRRWDDSMPGQDPVKAPRHICHASTVGRPCGGSPSD